MVKFPDDEHKFSRAALSFESRPAPRPGGTRQAAVEADVDEESDDDTSLHLWTYILRAEHDTCAVKAYPDEGPPPVGHEKEALVLIQLIEAVSIALCDALGVGLAAVGALLEVEVG